MDPVTHTLVGVGIANAFFRERPRALMTLALASNLPDVDALSMALGNVGLLYRRTVGHSVFTIPLWAAGLTWLLRKKWPELPYAGTYALCLLGASVHVVFDLINSFGVVPLWPFSDWRPELSIVFIVDLILTGLLAAPLLLALLPRFNLRLPQLSRLSLGLVTGYLMFCGTAHGLALVSLSEQAGRIGVRPDLLYVFPEALGPHRWRGVLRAGGIYRLYLIHTFSGQAEPSGEVETLPNDPRVRRVRDTPLGRRLDWFFKAPVWGARTGPEGVQVTAEDLRFRSLVLRREQPFRFTFTGDQPPDNRR